MAVLKYKTRGMVNPQGLPRVYFSCHPSDFATYFESISDEILKKQNCAIYYDEESGLPYDEEQLFSDLSQMQLFVMPVTTNLLTEESRALELELLFAMKEHIPVLPLMQESGLEALFNQKCGDLQFLDKNNRDVTAISYDEKLEKYLSSVLIGDEMAVKVRAAFDAYVFLSYRKKDRKYAQELMRLIHKNEFCRDIAIWYDEFLTPGENFNDAISDALKKSELFALVVTPNLINETNYVMTAEYPMAKEAGKPILPAEVVATDKEELSRKYENIPMCTDAHNEAELSEALLKAVQSMAIKENDKDPEHNFFIGLAYLSGIDVEVDKERAVELITSSAKAGLTEAMKKMVQMYRTGEGVVRNYETAVEWQKKLVEQLSTQYEACSDLKTKSDVMFALNALGEYLYELDRFQEAKAIYKRQEAVFNEVYEECKEEKFRSALLGIYIRLGEIEEAEGNMEGAKAYYKKILEISEELWKKTRMTIFYKGLLTGWYMLGGVAETEKNDKDARHYYRRSLEATMKLAETSGTVEDSFILSVNWQKYGERAREAGNSEGAEVYYKRSLEINEKLIKETGCLEAYQLSACDYDSLGELAKTKGNLEKAREYYKKSLESFAYVAKETETLDDYRSLAISYVNIGNLLRTEGNLSEAKMYYKKSIEIRERLAEKMGTTEFYRALSVYYARVGDIEKTEGNLEQARANYKKNLEIFRGLAEKEGTEGSYDDLALAYYKLGACQPYDISMIETAKNIWNQLCDSCPDRASFVKRKNMASNMLNKLKK